VEDGLNFIAFAPTFLMHFSCLDKVSLSFSKQNTIQKRRAGDPSCSQRSLNNFILPTLAPTSKSLRKFASMVRRNVLRRKLWKIGSTTARLWPNKDHNARLCGVRDGCHGPDPRLTSKTSRTTIPNHARV